MADYVLDIGVQLLLPIAFGIFFAMLTRNRYALLSAAALSWLVYLIYNLYAAGHTPIAGAAADTWLYFQLSVGSLVAVLALASAGLTLRWQRRSASSDEST